LIPFTIDFHLAAFQGTEDAASVSTVVLCGVTKSASSSQVADL
jgi:hypothetical protein